MNIALIGPLADTWGMHGDDFGAGWMVVMMVVMVLFWAAVILGIVWLVRGGFEGSWFGRGESAGEGRSKSATAILQRRFAEGAISAEDYRERRDVLEAEARRGHRRGGEAEGG